MKLKQLVEYLWPKKEKTLMDEEAICNKSDGDSKESSLIGDSSLSPAKLNRTDYETNVRTESNEPCLCCCGTSLCLMLLCVLGMIITVFVAIIISFAGSRVQPVGSYDCAEPQDPIILEVLPSPKSVSDFDKDTFQSINNRELPAPPKPDAQVCRSTLVQERLDCFPEDGANQKDCESRGCCWLPLESEPKNAQNDGAPLNLPYCFYPPNYQSYSFVNMSSEAFGIEALLERKYKSPYPDDVKVLKMIFRFETKDRLRIKMVDATQYRFEPPYPEVPIVDKAAINRNYDVVMNMTNFKVIRKSDNTVIFDSLNFLNFIYANQFLQFSAKLPTNLIYGLGEHRSSFSLMFNMTNNFSKYTMFNHDAIPQFNTNLYGSHPFYLAIEPSGNSHGVFLFNSNAMEIILQASPILTFRTIGGILDFFFFLGPSPEEVIQQYTEVIGRPHMPPYWGLGFHLCRFGYKTLSETRKVMQRNIDAGIPLDTQWNDLDYMNNSNDFTYDKENFKGLPEFVKELHSRGMHYIPLIDPGVSASEPAGSYLPYDAGIKMDIFIKNSTGQTFIGKVWNRATTVWPDFTNPKTVDYWTLMMKHLHDMVPFDGAWIDMNEPSNFWNGQIDGCPKSNLDNPPYTPTVDGGMLFYKTVCMSAKQFISDHYNVHNLYGYTEAVVTNFALSEIRGKRPMIISRSTFAGQGKYSGHWSGDVWSRWIDMRYTIPQLLSFSLYGIPLMGADICGFNGNTTEALCNRWMQLGAFYPFSRNHNTDDGIDQDPVAMGDQVVASSKKALNIRYSVLPYLYTLFHEAHISGTTVARPLFFEFIDDRNTYDIDTQFLWGPALMIVPVLEEDAVTVNGYLPAGRWYDYHNTKATIQSPGNYYTLSAPLDTIPVLIRGGYILPQQAPKQTTTESRKSKVELLVAVDENGEASGKLYWDDGDSLNSYEERRYSLFSFELENKVLRCVSIFLGPERPPNLGGITVLGVDQPVAKVTINDVQQSFKYDTLNKYLLIENLDVSFSKPIVVNWK